MKRPLPFLPLLLVGCLSEGFHPLRTEALGPLRPGMESREVTALLGPGTLGPSATRRDGAWRQVWVYPAAGVEVTLVRADAATEPRVEGLRVAAPCPWTTRRGVRVGSTEAEVRKAYGRDLDSETTRPGELLVAGATHGRLVFRLQGGRVSTILLAPTLAS